MSRKNRRRNQQRSNQPDAPQHNRGNNRGAGSDNVCEGGIQGGPRLGSHKVYALPNHPRQQSTTARPPRHQSRGQNWNDREQEPHVPRGSSHQPGRQYRNDREPQRGNSVKCNRIDCIRRLQGDREHKAYLRQVLEDQRQHIERWFPDDRDSEDEMDWQPEQEIIVQQPVKIIYRWPREYGGTGQDGTVESFGCIQGSL